MVNLESISSALDSMGDGIESLNKKFDGDQSRPVVVWVGFDDAPVSKPSAYRSVVKPVLDTAVFADPNVVAIVKRQESPCAEGLLMRLEEGAEGFLFRPQILTLSPDFKPADIELVDRVVQHTTSERYRALAQRNTDLTRQLFEVRRAHEDLQAAFEQVELYLHSNDLGEPKMLLELPLSEAGDIPFLELSAKSPAVLSLPYELNKIAGFSLYVRRAPEFPRSTARLLVTLMSATAGEIYGAWSTPVDRLPELGWFSFLLDRLSIDYGHSLRISLQLDGDAGVALGLSAKPLIGGSLTPKRVSESIEEACFALPAVRLWRGLPGTRMAHSSSLQPFDFECHGSARTERSVLLHLDQESVEQVFAAGSVAAPLVSVDVDEQSIQVHPVASGVAVAVVRQDMPLTKLRVEATVGVHHEEASDVEFAMVVAASTEEAIARFTGSSEGDSKVWTRASPRNHGSLFVECEAAETSRYLYLATKVPKEGTTKYAWARFGNIRLVL